MGQEKMLFKSLSSNEMPFRNSEARTSENQKLLSSILTTGQNTEDPEAQAGLVLEGRD